MEKVKNAVLLITFNRFECTKKVVDKLKDCDIDRIYIFNDGPRNPEDQKARDQIKKLIDDTEWKAEIKLWFSEKNLTCGYGVSSAISWAFEKEEKLIILEDDCVPTHSFFDFCNHNLEKYEHDDRVGIVVGRSHHDKPELFNGNDYVFSHYGFTWGWATWKRVWEKFDIDMKNWVDFKKEGGFINSFYSLEEVKYFDDFYERGYKTFKNHTWDYQLFYLMYSSSYLFVVPAKNLIENIGYIGTHNSGKMDVHTIQPVEGFKIKNEPQFIQADRNYDYYYFKHTIKRLPLYKRAVKKIFNLLKK